MFLREERKKAPVYRDVLKTLQNPLIFARLIGGDKVSFAVVPPIQDLLAPSGAVFFLGKWGKDQRLHCTMTSINISSSIPGIGYKAPTAETCFVE